MTSGAEANPSRRDFNHLIKDHPTAKQLYGVHALDSGRFLFSTLGNPRFHLADPLNNNPPVGVEK